EELGLQYQGKLLELEVLEPAAVAVNSESKSAKKEKATKTILTEKDKEKIKTPKAANSKAVATPKTATPSTKHIATFFKKLSPNSTNSSPVHNLSSTPKPTTPLVS